MPPATTHTAGTAIQELSDAMLWAIEDSFLQLIRLSEEQGILVGSIPQQQQRKGTIRVVPPPHILRAALTAWWDKWRDAVDDRGMPLMKGTAEGVYEYNLRGVILGYYSGEHPPVLHESCCHTYAVLTCPHVLIMLLWVSDTEQQAACGLCIPRIDCLSRPAKAAAYSNSSKTAC